MLKIKNYKRLFIFIGLCFFVSMVAIASDNEDSNEASLKAVKESAKNNISSFVEDKEYKEQVNETREQHASEEAEKEEAQKEAPLEEVQIEVAEATQPTSEAVATASVVQAEPVYTSNGSGLTKSGGVNYYDGRKETWYSSNVLHHYRTEEWYTDSEGFYHDPNTGAYVVAASDMPQGTTFQGSKGTCIVLDSGCAAGTTDYYVCW